MEQLKSLYVFIDASNIWEAQKAKGRLLDWLKMKTYLQKTYHSDSSVIYYYTAYPESNTRTYSTDGRHKFYTYLKKGLGFNVRKKPLKRIITFEKIGQVIKEKGNMDVEMTIDAVHNSSKYDKAVLFTGDSDFLELVNYLRRYGMRKVYIYSSKNNVSSELRTGSDGYVDVLEITESIWGKRLKRRKV